MGGCFRDPCHIIFFKLNIAILLDFFGFPCIQDNLVARYEPFLIKPSYSLHAIEMIENMSERSPLL